MKFSIAIPTYEMHGFGREFLDFSFQKLHSQTFKDFEIVISDHSADFAVERLCEEWMGRLFIRYFRNENKRGSSSANLNNAISQCRGEWIKILFQDDFLFSDESLLKLASFIDSDEGYQPWIACACQHTYDGVNMIRPFYPKWNKDLRLGINTISSPSVICIRNSVKKVPFNEGLMWLMDVDYYGKMHDLYGEPKYFDEITVVNRIWAGSVTNTLPEEVKRIEEYSAKRNFQGAKN